MKKKILSLLVLLMTAVSGAWAGIPTFQKTIFETTETLSTPIYVTEDTEITIADGAIVTINGGLIIEDNATLTVNGPGKLVVNGTNGSPGSQGQMMTGNPGGAGTDGSAAITGNIVVKGATVEANGGYGGKGGRGGSGTSGSNPGQGGKGGKGGKGAAAFTGAVTIFSGTITAKGGSGGDGGEGGEGGTNPMDFQNRGSEGDKGEGGANGNAFAGTLTFYGGTVNVVPGSNPGYGKPSGNVSNAFVNPVTMKATTYELRGSNTGNNTAIELAEIVNYRYVSITAADYVESTFDYELTVEASDHGSGKVKFFIEGNEEPVTGAMQADEGKTVTMTVTPDEGWVVDDTKVKAESYSTWEAAGAPSRRAPGNIQILGDVTLNKSTTAENTWTFTMPAASVLVSAGYIKSSTLYFDPADKTNLVKVTVDGTDRNLNGSKTVKIKRVDNVLEGTAVSLKANDGYKFRKVQVTKTDNGLKLTNPTVGQVIGSDGKNYAYASLPTGVTAVAKICYVSGNSGLALALTDESSMMDWATAIETCAAHTPAFKGAEWKLASQDEWNNMKSAAGNYANLRNGFSSVGGTDMRSLQEETYWSSTEQVNSQNAWYMLNSGNWYRHDKSVTKYVRACLAF